MEHSHIFGVLLALSSALVYGSADFSGGVATRRAHQFQVLALASFASVIFMGTFMIIGRETLPSVKSIGWASSAGIAGALGIVVFYRALSLGNMAIVAPIAGVIGAILPVLFSIVTEGFPRTSQLLGFIIAALGIWFVTRTSSQSEQVNCSKGIFLAVLSGLGFGSFFILIAQVESGSLFASLTIQKSASACIALLLLMSRRLSFPPLQSNPVAFLAGILDAGANALYLFAKQFTRLDVAAVLSSLYPAATVILACVLLKERISRLQWAGVILCMAAIGFIVS